MAVRATCLKGCYVDVTTREDVNSRRCARRCRRNGWSTAGIGTGRRWGTGGVGGVERLTRGVLPRKHPRLLPDGARDRMLDAVRTARDRMIVTWLGDSGMRIGELCGLWFCDLHLRKDHPVVGARVLMPTS